MMIGKNIASPADDRDATQAKLERPFDDRCLLATINAALSVTGIARAIMSKPRRRGRLRRSVGASQVIARSLRVPVDRDHVPPD
jgi:hypothetical protein